VLQEQKRIVEKVIAANNGNKPDHLPLWAFDEMEKLDTCITEVLRLTLSGTTFRRVMKEGYKIGKYDVPAGSFLTHPVGLTHLDQKLYPNAQVFDPDRIETRKEHDQEKMAFLGWGTGRHPCLGMKFAKLEIKAIVFILYALFEFDLAGQKLPPPNRNNLHTTRPSVPVSISFSKKKNPML